LAHSELLESPAILKRKERVIVSHSVVMKFLVSYLFQGLFFKDSNSLAYYNIMPGTVINLQLKERGGRKK